LGAILSAIGPWLERFFALGLISDYFQPAWNRAASAMAALAFLIVYGRLRRAPAARLWRIIAGWLVAGSLGLVVCLVLKFSVGTVIAPGTAGTVLLWVGWSVAYFVLFIALAIVLCAAALLAAGGEGSA
jgi:hypothetical protein